MARERSCLTVPFVTLNANELSETMGVACWGWSISINVVQIVTAFWQIGKQGAQLCFHFRRHYAAYDGEFYLEWSIWGSGNAVGYLVGSCG